MNFESEFLNLKNQINLKSDNLQSNDFLPKLTSLLEVLSHPDQKVRDNLGWSTLSDYFQGPLMPIEWRRQLLHLLLSEHFLFFNIDNGESDASVKRSFSLLCICDLLWGDQDFGCTLNKEELQKVAEKLSAYLMQEKDERGLDAKLGWVHGIAHSGDALTALIMHPNTTEATVEFIVETIADYLQLRENRTFVWDEQLRLSRPLERAIFRLPKSKIEKHFFEKFESDKVHKSSAKQNLLNTLRCLYIELQCNKFKEQYVFDWLMDVTTRF